MVAKYYPTKRISSVQNLVHHQKFFQQQASTNTTMASMPQETAAGITALKPSSRKQRREFIKGVQQVTTDPNDLIQSDNEEEEELVPQKMDAKQGWRHAYGNPPSLPSTIGSMHTEIHHPYLQLLKSGNQVTAN